MLDAVPAWLIPLIFVVLALPAVVAFRRMGELFLLDVRGDEVITVRGRIPGPLLDDLGDVLRGHDGLRIRAVVRDGRAQLDIQGGETSPALRQRLRNVISLWPLAKIRNAPVRRGAARRAKRPA